MLLQHKPLMRTLRRTHTSASSPPSPANSNSNSSSPLSWIHLRSVLLVVASLSPSSSSSPSPLYTNRGSLKSPWSMKRRKRALLPKQWKSLFDMNGRLSDGGVKFLKKVRSGGVDPSIRSEVWPFLLGVYDVNSSTEERDAIKATKRKEYINLRRKCRQLLKPLQKTSFKNPEPSGNNSNDESSEITQVLDSPRSENDTKLSFKPSSTFVERESTDGTISHDYISESESSDNSISSSEPEETPLIKQESEESDLESDSLLQKSGSMPKPEIIEDFSTWQRIIRVDAIRANAEWVIYSPTQANVSDVKARRLAESVGLKDYDHLEPCRIFHASRLVAILEAYALYDPEIGYCQGMSDLLTPIISVMEKDYEAFWCFVGFMKKARHNFRLDEVGIRRQLTIVSRIIQTKDVHLYRHLENLEAEDCFFVYRMVVVLFRRELNFEQTLCLWEVMWADQAAIRASIAKSAWGRMRLRAPPTDDLLLYAISACVLQRRKLIIEKYSSMDEILRECNSMAGQLDVWKLLDDAHDLVVTLHDKIQY